MDNNIQSEAGHTEIWEDLLVALWSQKFVVIFVTLLVMISTYSVLQTRPELYETSSVLLVKLAREAKEIPASGGVRVEDVNSEIKLLLSPQLLEGVIDRIGPEAFRGVDVVPQTFVQKVKYYVKRFVRGVKSRVNDILIWLDLRKRLDEKTKLLKGLQKTVSAVRGKDTDTIILSMRSPNPVLAERVLSTLVELYLQRRLEVRRARQLQGFFDVEVESLVHRLDELQEQGNRLRAEYGVSDVALQREHLLKRLYEIYAELNNYQSDLELLERGALSPDEVGETGEVSLGVGEGSSEPNSMIPVAVATLKPLRDRLAALELERAKLLQSFEPTAAAVQIVTREIASVSNVLHDALQRRVAYWQDLAHGVEGQIARLNEAETKLDDLKRELRLAENNYYVYNERKENVRIDSELDLRRVSNIAVLSPAFSTPEPVRPRKLLISALSIPVGLLLGIALALLFEYFNDVIRSYRDLSRVKGVIYLGEFRA